MVLILGFCILIANTYAYANSDPTYWKGYPSYETLTIEENKSLEVIKEDLIFDFNSDDDTDYRDYNSMYGRVTARYTI